MSFAALQGSVPVLGVLSAGRGCHMSHGNCIGAHARGRATLRCDSRAQLTSLNVLKGRVVTAAGSSRKVSAGWYLCACLQGGYAGGVEGEGCTS